MKSALIFACSAGLAMSASTLADDTPVQTGCIAMPAPNDTAFSSRFVVVVWGTNASDFRGYNTAIPAARAANDINFAGGPAASANGNVHLVGSYFGVVTPAGATLTTCDVRVSVYSTFTGWIDGTFPGTNLTGQATLAGFVGNPGFVNFYDPTTNITMALGDVPNTAGTDGMFMVEVFSPGTTTLHPTSWTPSSIGTALVTGSSDPVRWGDVTGLGGVGPADGLCQPYTTSGAALECNLATVPGARAIYGGLWGDIQGSNCGGCEPIPPLQDGVTTRSPIIAAGFVKWYQVELNWPADDDVLKYLDIDSEGSVDDVSMCLYDNAGAIVGYPGNDDGSGFNAQLSFGVGRRAAIGDGAQYDGRMDDLPNSGFNYYYLAVGGEGTTFGPSFTASAQAVTTHTNATINFRTNVNAGANLPSAAPEINGVDFNDPIEHSLAAGETIGARLLHDSLSVDQVRWSTFTLDRAVCAQDGYLDINFLDPTLSDGVADGVAWVFDQDGDIVALSDDTGNTNKPQFSFGVIGSARPPYGGSTQNFSGQDGNLDAGTYYIATALYDNDNSDLSFLSTGHRWHVRGASLSQLNIGAVLTYLPSTTISCPPDGLCEFIDFNNDGSLFDPQDIDAFLSVYSEGPCIPATATCNDIDFNNDGSVFDPCDIDSFLLVFSEGPCTPCGI